MFTFAAFSVLSPPFLKQDHGACSSMYKFPRLLISKTDSHADDSKRFSYWCFALSTCTNNFHCDTTILTDTQNWKCGIY